MSSTTKKKSSNKSSLKVKYCKDVSANGVKCTRPSSIQGGDYCRFHAARIAQYAELDFMKELSKINPELANELILHTKEGIDPRVERLLLVNQHMPEQRTEEWYDYRNRIMTASPAGCYIFVSDYEYALAKTGLLCMDTDGKPVKKTHIGKKRCNCFPGWKQQVEIKCIGEKSWSSNKYTRHGVKYEPVITAIYERKTGKKVLEFGIMPHSSIDWLGASPDGIRPDGIMVEIKAPSREHLTEEIILQYWIQMQLQMEVCDLDECDFVEARIKDYVSKEDYLEDTFYDEEGNLVYHLNSEGNPKGIVLTIEKNVVQGDLDKIVREYVYPFPDGGYFESFEEEEDWIRGWISEKVENNVDMFIEDDTRIRVTYYNIVEWECRRVNRDREWFKLRKPDFEESWNTILKYRKEGVPDDLLSKPPKKVTTKKSDYGFADSDEEDEVDHYGHGLTSKWKKMSAPEPKSSYRQTTIPMLDLGFDNRKTENDTKYESDVFH
jgi:putative phage-type endonuclease